MILVKGKIFITFPKKKKKVCGSIPLKEHRRRSGLNMKTKASLYLVTGVKMSGALPYIGV